ncbi:MAG: alpha-amylase family glycosyl hydrolase [Anaerolineae bacterium]
MAGSAPTTLEHLIFLYGKAEGRAAFSQLGGLLDQYRPRLPSPHRRRPTADDSILITYPDMLRDADIPPLTILGDFLAAHARDRISAVHLLPFSPSSSDEGFSVVDYESVAPEFGTWEDIVRLSRDFRLMFDVVINHVSAHSEWFRRFLAGDPRYEDHFIVVDDGVDVSQVFRPRASPLLTPVETSRGEELVWTTFSQDQMDLNYANPRVLLDMLEVILTYVVRGADFIRLDAIAYLWKEIGTPCIHLPQTHRLVQLIRAVLEEVAPQVLLITETNVAHEENITYFGDGTNEAHLIYNFALPPLVLDAIHQGDATTLSEWAATLHLPSDRATLFNFLASHDGIGILPARGILSDQAIEAMAERTQRLGGQVSYRANPDGSQSPYELNINYLDALGDPEAPDEDPGELARRFLCAQGIMLALRGVPGVYFHSLFGSRGWPEGPEETGVPRSINRERLDRGQLERELGDRAGLRNLVLRGHLSLLAARAAAGKAFDPYGDQEVVSIGPAIFAVLRRGPDGQDHALCIHNVTGLVQEVQVALDGLAVASGRPLRDLITAEDYQAAGGSLSLNLAPYQAVWLLAGGP